MNKFKLAWSDRLPVLERSNSNQLQIDTVYNYPSGGRVEIETIVKWQLQKERPVQEVTLSSSAKVIPSGLVDPSMDFVSTKAMKLLLHGLGRVMPVTNCVPGVFEVAGYKYADFHAVVITGDIDFDINFNTIPDLSEQIGGEDLTPSFGYRLETQFLNYHKGILPVAEQTWELIHRVVLSFLDRGGFV